MCKDSGIVGFPPDQYEDCPDCRRACESAPASAQPDRGAVPMYQAQFDGEYGSSVWRDVTEAAYHTFIPKHRRIVYASPAAVAPSDVTEKADLLDALQKAARLLRAAGFCMTGTATSKIVAAINAHADATGKADAANAGGMEDRITKLRAALRQISETSFGWDGDCGVTKIADDALYADEQTASPATSAADAKDAEPTDAMIEAYLAFTARASHLSHPDVPYAGTINGDSEEKWRRRFAAAAIRAAIAATQQAAPVPSAPACPWCEKHALIPGHREDSAQIFQCAACLNLSHLSPVDQQAQSSAKGGDAVGGGE